MADKINKKNIAENSTEAWKLPVLSRAHQTAKNDNHLMSLMEVQ